MSTHRNVPPQDRAELEAAGFPDEEVAAWVMESVHRRQATVAESTRPPREAGRLIEHLEALTGRTFAEPEDIERLLLDINAAQAAAARQGQRRRIVREGVLLFALALAYLQYYYWDVQLQMISLPTVQIFVPVQAPKQPLKSGTGSDYVRSGIRSRSTQT